MTWHICAYVCFRAYSVYHIYDRCNYIDSTLREDWVLSLYVQILVCQEPWWWQFVLVNAGHRWWRHQMETFSALLAIHRSPVYSPHIGQWRGALMFSLICVRINGLVNNGEAGDLRRHRAHYDVNVMSHLVYHHVESDVSDGKGDAVVVINILHEPSSATFKMMRMIIVIMITKCKNIDYKWATIT